MFVLLLYMGLEILPSQLAPCDTLGFYRAVDLMRVSHSFAT